MRSAPGWIERLVKSPANTLSSRPSSWDKEMRPCFWNLSCKATSQECSESRSQSLSSRLVCDRLAWTKQGRQTERKTWTMCRLATYLCIRCSPLYPTLQGTFFQVQAEHASYKPSPKSNGLLYRQMKCSLKVQNALGNHSRFEGALDLKWSLTLSACLSIGSLVLSARRPSTCTRIVALLYFSGICTLRSE